MRKTILGVLVSSIVAATVIGFSGSAYAGHKLSRKAYALDAESVDDDQPRVGIQDLPAELLAQILLEAFTGRDAVDPAVWQQVNQAFQRAMFAPGVRPQVQARFNEKIGSLSDDRFDQLGVVLQHPEVYPMAKELREILAIAVKQSRRLAFPQVAPVEDHFGGTRKWKKKDFIQAWEKSNSRSMPQPQRTNLDRGLVNVSVANGEEFYQSDSTLALSFATFEQSLRVQKALEKILAKNPTTEQFKQQVRSDKVLRDLSNIPAAVHGMDLRRVKPIIFSQRFYMGGANGGAGKYRPNAKTGQIDMSYYRYEAKPSYVPFDLAWYDENTNNWWHTTQMEYSNPRKAAEGPMYIYQSTLEHYSRPLLDFNNQVFTVTFGARQLKK